MKELKQRVLDYIHHLTIYDYFALSWVGVFFLFVMMIAFLNIKKRASLAISILLISFVLVAFSPIFIKLYFDKTVRKVEILNQKITKLNFANMLIIKGSLQNQGKIDYKKCRIFTKVVKKDENKYKNILNNLKPLRKKSILLDRELKKEEKERFKIVMKDFNLKDMYEVKVSGECY